MEKKRSREFYFHGSKKQVFYNIFTDNGFLQILFLVCMILASILILFGGSLLLPAPCYPDRLYSVTRSFFDTSYAWNGCSAFFPIVGLLGDVLFGGLLISVLTSIIINIVNRTRQGEVEYHLKNHIVVIGYDNITPSLVEGLLRNGKYCNSAILLYSCQPIDNIRDNVLSKCNKKDKKKIVFMHSTQTSFDDLRKLHTIDCKEIFVVGDRQEDGHDSENMRIVRMLLKIHDELSTTEKKKINVWFENESSFAAMQLTDIADTKAHPEMEESRTFRDYFYFIPRNFYSGWAKKLLVQSYYQKNEHILRYPELDHGGIKLNSNKHVHLIVVGMNRMGIALAKEAAHLMHFPNFLQNSENRTIITFIDDNADQEMNFFKGRHPGYFEIAPTLFANVTDGSDVLIKEIAESGTSKIGSDFLDVRFQFIKGRIESSSIREWLAEQASDKSQYVSIAICLENPADSIGAALYLPETVYFNDRKDGDEINIFVRQQSSSSFVEFLQQTTELGQNKKYAHIYPFGMYDNCINPDLSENIDACSLNYVYDYYYKHDKTLPSQLPSLCELTEALLAKPISHIWSNIYLANSLEFKLRSFDMKRDDERTLEISDNDRLAMAIVEHNRWNMEKLLVGYRAPHVDEYEKMKLDSKYLKAMKEGQHVHYDIRPFDELSKSSKQNDRNIVDSLPMIIKFSNHEQAN